MTKEHENIRMRKDLHKKYKELVKLLLLLGDSAPKTSAMEFALEYFFARFYDEYILPILEDKDLSTEQKMMKVRFRIMFEREKLKSYFFGKWILEQEKPEKEPKSKKEYIVS